MNMAMTASGSTSMATISGGGDLFFDRPSLRCTLLHTVRHQMFSGLAPIEVPTSLLFFEMAQFC
jgi:hypothetical protein